MTKKKKEVSPYTYFWDIETSHIITDNGGEMQITFLSNVLKCDSDTGEILEDVFHRTIAEVIEYFSDQYGIVWVHNLDYELYFLLREGQFNLNPEKANLLRAEHAPLQLNFIELPNITFRDTYALFNTSVEKLGDDIIEYKSGKSIKELKKSGEYEGYKNKYGKLDYEYTKIRCPWDELEEHDYNYNRRDNEIVRASIFKYMREHNYTIDEIPLTFTSQVRRERKKFITENYGVKALNPYYFDRDKFFINQEITEDFLLLYQGGLTASIECETNKAIDDKSSSGVLGVDIKSSYPNQMVTRRFPRFIENNQLVGEMANEKFKRLTYKDYFMGTFIFTNIRRRKEGYILPISKSQIRDSGSDYENAKFFNGKLVSAEKLTLRMNEIDLKTVNLVYQYDDIECIKILTTQKSTYIRQEEVSFLLFHFLNKEKNINKKIAKLIINSMYGVKVANPFKSEYEIIDGEVIEHSYEMLRKDGKNSELKRAYEKLIENLKPFQGGIDVYSDGIWVTSYARNQLVNLQTYIVDKGGHVVYSDTDSIKFYCDTKEELDILCADIISKNKKKVESNLKLYRFKQFKEKFKVSDEDMNKIALIGIWEIEDEQPHKLFKTLGAKKYGYVNYKDEVKTTIAGCNKKKVAKAITKYAEKNKISNSEALSFIFDIGTQFDESCSGRTLARRDQRPYEEFFGITYKGHPVNQYGGTIIEDTTYTLGVSKEDMVVFGLPTNNTKVDEEENEVIMILNDKGEIKWNLK